ncbi:MAG: CBS domain-containing protein [Bdellovibrionota bacterium]
MLCQDVMTKNPKTCGAKESAEACAKLMEGENVGLIPVVDAGGKVTGVVTDRDIALRVVGAGKTGSTPLSKVMTKEIVSCRPKEDLHLAEDRMCRAKKSRILVLNDDGTCAGVISLSDIGQVEERHRAGQVMGSVTKREARP